MKNVIAPILASVLSGAIGYWAVGGTQSLPPVRLSSSQRVARRASPAVIAPAVAKLNQAPDVDVLLASDKQPATSQPMLANAESSVPQEAEISEGAIPESAEASVDDNIRFTPTTRPTTPEPQHPPLADKENVDTGKPVHEWQRLTDDWFGLRPTLDDRGIAIQASLTTDYSKVLTGGTDTAGSTFLNLFNFTITLDTERLLKWQGGTLFFDFQNQSGRNGAEDVGDLQGISNIDADGFTQISELWYEQILLDGKLRLKAGKVDANSDFAHTPSADEFINGAFGAAPTILGFPTYPDPATSFNVFVTPNDCLFASFGVYDGSTQNGQETGAYGPANTFDGSYFYIGEAGVKWTTPRGLDGTLTFGAWHHSGDFEQFDGGTDSGATGEYVMLDQKLWRENPDDKDDEQGASMFAKYSYVDPDISAITQQIAIGFACTGLIPQRDDDVLGAGMSWAKLSDQGGFEHNSEVVYELFYRVRLNAWFSVKPDLQYIHNAADGGARDTVAGTVRVVIDF